MILVDIFVPAVDKNYNFSLNEDVELEMIIAEITEMIGQKEQTHLYGSQDELNLFSLRDKRRLPRTNTLTDCLVKQGDALMMV